MKFANRIVACVCLAWMSVPVQAQHPGACRISAQGAGGSGVLFAKNEQFAFCLTCDHVTEHLPKDAIVTCIFPELERHNMNPAVKGRLLSGTRKIDASVVVIGARYVKPLQPVAFHQGPVHRGDTVISDGFPARGGRQRYTQLKGRITGVHWDGSLATTAIPSSGHSGGPIYSSDWRLIGVMSGYRYGSGSPVRSWGLRIGPLRTWLCSLRWRLRAASRPEVIVYTRLGFTQAGGCYPICQPSQPPSTQPSPSAPLYSDPGFGGAERPPSTQPVPAPVPSPPVAQPVSPPVVQPAPTPPAIQPVPAQPKVQPEPCPDPKLCVPGRVLVEIDYDQIADRLAEDGRFRGPAGPEGPPGPRGDTGQRGDRGAVGPPGERGEVSADQLAALGNALLERIREDDTFRGPEGPRGRDGKDAPPVIAQNLPPITFRVIDENGKVIDREEVRLGDNVDLTIDPAELEIKSGG